MTRELKEELGVDVKIGPPCYRSIIGPREREDLLLIFRVEEIVGKISQSEHEQVKWVAPTEFTKYDIIPFYWKFLRKLSGI